MTPASKSHETRERASYALRICARPKSTHRSSPAPEHVQVSDIGNRGPHKYGPDGWERSASGERDAPHLFTKSPALGVRSAHHTAFCPASMRAGTSLSTNPAGFGWPGLFSGQAHSFGNSPLTATDERKASRPLTRARPERGLISRSPSGGERRPARSPRTSQVAA